MESRNRLYICGDGECLPVKRHSRACEERMILLELLDTFIFTLDSMLDTPRKRHIMGGILLSASALFGGLAVTILTIKN